MTVRKHIYVSGRVQGVFFRETTRRIAEDAGLAGSARNLSDGRVEVILEGDHWRVEAVVKWLHKGPGDAHVTDVEVADEPPLGLTGFSIA